MRKFIIKTILFLSLLIPAQILIAHPSDKPNELLILDYLLPHGAEIVYFGDSTINWAGEHDKNNADMPKLLRLLLPKMKILKISYPSYQMDVYAAYAQYIVQKGYHPKFVIVPINMRSFSPEWDRRPLWQFRKEQFVARHSNSLWMKFYQPLGVFKFFESNISAWEYQQTKVYTGGALIGKVKDFDNPLYASPNDEKTKRQLLFRYMYDLTADHRKIKSMLHMVDVLKNNGIKVILYITPLDVQTGKKYLGDDFSQKLDKNVQLITSLLAGQGVPVLDFSKSLDTKYFTWWENKKELYPNEHLQLLGRMFVVKNLVYKTDLKNYLRTNK